MNETKDIEQPKKLGRKPINGIPLTSAELQQRHREKLKKKGHKILQTTIREPELVEVLKKLKRQRGFTSDTSAANWVMSQALEVYKGKVD
jgi:hypothetical protein